MLDKILKDKKRVGIIILAIIILISSVMYYKSGFKELKKNNNESIFVDDGTEDIETSNIINKAENKKDNGTSRKESKISLKDNSIIVEIKGEVKKPDVYKLEEESIVKDLIDQAGGLTENADISNINRAKKLQNHELIYIANKNNKNNMNSKLQNENTLQSSESSEGKININTASIEELKKINGIGEAKAKKIIEYREKSGGFKSIEDIKKIGGIGEKSFEKLKDQIET